MAPTTGVEVVEATDIDGVSHYTMRDLRNDQIARNVTAQTARSLWAQAIREYEKGVPDADRVRWIGERAFWKSTRINNGERRYHLLSRDEDGKIHTYFGVSTDNLAPEWQELIDAEQEARRPAEA